MYVWSLYLYHWLKWLLKRILVEIVQLLNSIPINTMKYCSDSLKTNIFIFNNRSWRTFLLSKPLLTSPHLSWKNPHIYSYLFISIHIFSYPLISLTHPNILWTSRTLSPLFKHYFSYQHFLQLIIIKIPMSTS